MMRLARMYPIPILRCSIEMLAFPSRRTNSLAFSNIGSSSEGVIFSKLGTSFVNGTFCNAGTTALVVVDLASGLAFIAATRHVSTNRSISALETKAPCKRTGAGASGA